MAITVRCPLAPASYPPSKYFRHLSLSTGFGVSSREHQEFAMRSPRQSGRREARYRLHLPVSVKLAGREMDTQSENISLNGILLSSSFLIPEGSTVELAVAVGKPAHSGAFPDESRQGSARTTETVWRFHGGNRM
jgi:hypothetical protein